MEQSSINQEHIDIDSEGMDVDETQQSTQPTNDPSVQKKRQRKLTSSIWSHFEILPLEKDNIERAKCKYCPKIYASASKNGTSSMRRHKNGCCKTTTRDVGQMLITQANTTMSLREPKFSHDVFRDLLNLAIIRHELPFRFAEYEGIRDLLNYVAFANQEIKIVCRNTVKADTLKIYEKEKSKIRQILRDVPGKISLTSDLWSSITRDGYISLTTHYVNHEWKLEKRVLNFSYMPSPHNGLNICDKIFSMLTYWGIENKLSSITLDNASSNDTFVGFLKERLIMRDALFSNGEFFHVRCCAHVVNLIVHEGLKEIDSAVEKIRESVRYYRGSQGRKQTFKEC